MADKPIKPCLTALVMVMSVKVSTRRPFVPTRIATKSQIITRAPVKTAERECVSAVDRNVKTAQLLWKFFYYFKN